jgi:hypothetical protein
MKKGLPKKVKPGKAKEDGFVFDSPPTNRNKQTEDLQDRLEEEEWVSEKSQLQDRHISIHTRRDITVCYPNVLRTREFSSNIPRPPFPSFTPFPLPSPSPLEEIQTVTKFPYPFSSASLDHPKPLCR